MPWSDALAAIEARMAANWTATPVVYANEDENDEGKIVDGEPWVFFDPVETEARIAQFGHKGSNQWRNYGQIWAHVFVPRHTHRALARQYARQIGDIFRGQGFGDLSTGALVQCMAPVIDGTPVTDSGGRTLADDSGQWWRVSVMIEFRYDYIG